MRRNIAVPVFFFVLTLCQPVFSDEAVEVPENGRFLDGLAVPAGWGRPFWADVHSTLVRVECAWATNSPEYDWSGTGDDFRPFVFSNLGADLPVWSGNFLNGKFGLAVTLPFMIDVWLDMFERTTAPVINTGYRFGAFEFGFIHRLAAPVEFVPKWRVGLYNYTIRISPLKHECTHIGDELTIFRKNDSMDITRVNVSYNYAELTLTINDPEKSRKMNHGFRFGAILLHDFGKGWYDILPQEADTEVVEFSQLPFEIYGQYQFQSGIFGGGFQIIASGELRFRERYKYPFSYSGRQSDYWERYPQIVDWKNHHTIEWCQNIFVGIRYDNPRGGYFSKIGIGLRYYNGVNPYGQFRSQHSYDQWGIALFFE